jgi:voltage-gated potassium channel
MRAETEPAVPRSRPWRRRALVTLAGSLLAAAVIVVGYFLLPLTSALAVDSVLELLAGLAVLGLLIAWQIREILRSPYPAVQAFSALVVALPLFLTLFAVTYYLMGKADAPAFSEPLTRLDAMYFTVTVFATVGFGDITAVSEAARGVVIVQMLLGLVLVGVIARVIFGAVQEGRRRQGGRP